jgi:MraZ protein
MFLGQYEHTIDEKGRLTIPAKFREELGDGLILTQGFEGSLLALPPDLFEQMSNRVRSMSITDSNSRALRRFIFASASLIEIDKAGRMLLPSFLRDSANLADNAVLVGNGEYFEVWSPEVWQQQCDLLSDPEANEKRFSALDLTTLP